mmetsp:Transcript_100855/g.284512  ORF Transcript_100855/g.284512 Transcript_100855/m.284512 type:complete len:213 (+) Transcript_100855:1282-1920(+)
MVNPSGCACPFGESARNASPPHDAVPTSARVALIFPRVTCGDQAPSPAISAKYELGIDMACSRHAARMLSRSCSKAGVASKRATTRFIFSGGNNSKPRKVRGSVGGSAQIVAACTDACTAAWKLRNSPAGILCKCSPKNRKVMCKEFAGCGSKPAPDAMRRSSDGHFCKARAALSIACSVPRSKATARKALRLDMSGGGFRYRRGRANSPLP